MKQVIQSALLAISLAFGFGAAAQADEPIKVVYHLSDGVEQAARAMQNIKNHLAADPTAKIVVVGHGKGIDFMLQDASTPKGGKFEGLVSGLASQNVEFRACNNTLVGRKIDPSDLLLETKVVPSGVAEVARLQAKEGYVYLRP
ncbi:MAG: DsrE family protein [Burkholderiaceae bacterium]|nr:DsrE family protein [Burkholderiaceae bacterium]